MTGRSAKLSHARLMRTGKFFPDVCQKLVEDNRYDQVLDEVLVGGAGRTRFGAIEKVEVLNDRETLKVTLGKERG
jgi:hypothetical protein